MFSLNPDAFTGAAAGRGLRVIGIGFLLDDLDDFFDGQICLRIAGANTGDGDVAIEGEVFKHDVPQRADASGDGVGLNLAGGGSPFFGPSLGADFGGRRHPGRCQAREQQGGEEYCECVFHYQS